MKAAILILMWIGFLGMMYLPLYAMTHGMSNSWGWLYLFNLLCADRLYHITHHYVNNITDVIEKSDNDEN